MKRFQLSEIAQIIGATLQGMDASCTGISTDTRSLKAGDLFIALEGPNFNGHDFIKQAEIAHACGVLVHQKVETHLAQLSVENTQFALGALAQYYRNCFDLPIAVVTGSSGKTTVKEMVSAILGQVGSVLANIGNFNNEIGVPLSLLQLEDKHQFGIFELGARRKGDIDYLVKLVSPTIAAITNIGTAHLEIFGSRVEIARTKGEIYQLPPTGIAIWHQEEEFTQYWRSLLAPEQRIITFGFGKSSDISCQNVRLNAQDSTFDLVTDLGTIAVRLPVPGRHNVLNALAAAAIARAFNMMSEDIARGLGMFKNVHGRLQNKAGLQGSCIIDDTYNANPQSVEAALSVLSTYSGEKVFVMGDMLELGEESAHLHQAIGIKARELGIDRLFGMGEMTQYAVDGFQKGQHFDNQEQLLTALLPLLHQEMTILVKGSRGMRMEKIIDQIIQR